MRLLVLTGVAAQHDHVAARIAQAFPHELQAIVVAPAPTAYEKVRTTLTRHGWAGLTSIAFRRLFGPVLRRLVLPRSSRRRETRALRARDSALSAPVIRVASHNSSECLRLLSALRPEVVAVYGTAVLKRKLLRSCAATFLNLHTGIAPRYRGSDAVFWALHNEEPQHVGVTVHEVDHGIDTGPVHAVRRPSIDPDDDEASLFRKCLLLGADLYVEVIRGVAESTLVPVPQQLEVGRQYRSVERTLAAELRLARALKRGLLRDYCESAE